MWFSIHLPAGLTFRGHRRVLKSSAILRVSVLSVTGLQGAQRGWSLYHPPQEAGRVRVLKILRSMWLHQALPKPSVVSREQRMWVMVSISLMIPVLLSVVQKISWIQFILDSSLFILLP